MTRALLSGKDKLCPYQICPVSHCIMKLEITYHNSLFIAFIEWFDTKTQSFHVTDTNNRYSTNMISSKMSNAVVKGPNDDLAHI